MDKKTYISVILPLKLEWEPCYSIPEAYGSGIIVGDRVRVAFANRIYVGVVSAVGIEPDIEPSRILPIKSVEGGLERILPQEIELWRKVAGYYMCSIGEVCKAAYPYGKIGMEEGRAAALRKDEERKAKAAAAMEARLAILEERLGKKRELWAKSRKESTRAAYAEDISRLEREIEALKAGRTDAYSKAENEVRQPLECFIELSPAQKKAYDDVCEGFAERKPVLLHGVTGSGKTEIYMKLACEAMRKGKNVLYLVPEIAVSRQLEDRLRSMFGDSLLVFHSGETAAGKRNTAETLRNSEGQNHIVLGTRSAIFLPHRNLGLIVVDEEHDSSYKQDSPAPRYNGRDTALMLSQIHSSDGERCSVILGSATPSLEELYNCRTGRHKLVELKERYHGSETSDIEIIDTKAERRKRGMVGNFSRKLIDHINTTLAEGGQAIILRSRRAWSPVLQCESCGEIQKCLHCNVSLSMHKAPYTSAEVPQQGTLTCHYCGYSTPYTGSCMKCGGPLARLGAGTQRIEEEAAALFPAAAIARLDSDTAQSKSFELKTIQGFSKGEIDILIGTQIVTKGFDFSNLTLVAVIAADGLLGMQDFRADEKAVQLLEQFRGRCGRREKKGMFVIQTSQSEHPVYQRLLRNEATEFTNELLDERRDFFFPPYSRTIEITIKDIYADRADRMASSLFGILSAGMNGTAAVIGPYSPAVDKVADHHIRMIRISLHKDKYLSINKKAITDRISSFEREKKYDGHISINVDPS